MQKPLNRFAWNVYLRLVLKQLAFFNFKPKWKHTSEWYKKMECYLFHSYQISHKLIYSFIAEESSGCFYDSVHLKCVFLLMSLIQNAISLENTELSTGVGVAMGYTLSCLWKHNKTRAASKSGAIGEDGSVHRSNYYYFFYGGCGGERILLLAACSSLRESGSYILCFHPWSLMERVGTSEILHIHMTSMLLWYLPLLCSSIRQCCLPGFILTSLRKQAWQILS